MPPRSYYFSPKELDYIRFAEAFFPDEIDDAKKFVQLTGKPYIGSRLHLAAYLGVSQVLLRQIASNKKNHYRTFEIAKKNGKPRVISTPRTYLKVIQWWILDNLFVSSDEREMVHGFVRGRSYLTNARVHMGANHIVNLDIERFFPSITEKMVQRVFVELGYSNMAASMLADLCVLDGVAPTGAPTSPQIGNHVLKEFDEQIHNFCANAGLIYTRYADDLTFSSVDRIPEKLVPKISGIIEKFGFRLNRNKTNFMGRGDRMEVTGVVINEGLHLPREWRNWARGYLHRVVLNPEQYVGEWQKIGGIYGTLKAFDRDENEPLTKKAQLALKTLRNLAPKN